MHPIYKELTTLVDFERVKKCVVSRVWCVCENLCMSAFLGCLRGPAGQIVGRSVGSGSAVYALSERRDST